ncbi:MAG: branched-chain amino acid ABC transporter permease [Treponema sp.]|jgi:branched-chain amino acid transport system permease protein|nr:branched-chain amino acid ABC transporter permease [Treponema sp.]
MFLQQLINGLTIGTTYALVTIGFTMVYSVLELANFAHSSFYMLGAYLSMTTLMSLGLSRPVFLLGLVVSVAVCGSLGALMDRFTLRLIRNRAESDITAMLCTVGVQTAIDNSILVIFGSETKSFPNVISSTKILIGSAVISHTQIVILITAVILMLCLSFFIYKTKMGAAMRAISQNLDAARLMGINTGQVVTLTFFIAAGIAAVAGTLVGSYYQANDIMMSASVGSKSFAAAVLGGMGSLPGAVLGGLIIGLAETMVAGYLSSGYRDAVAFIILTVVLIVRPRGFFGQKQLIKV